MTSQKARRTKSETVRGPDRGCSPHRNAYNCAVRWEKRKPVTRTRDVRCVAQLLRDGGYSYDQSKHLIAEARRRVRLTPPQRKKGSVERLTREELKALRRAACLLSLRPLSIGRFERSSECEARSIRKTTARSISSLISAQSAGTTLCSTESTSSDQSWSRRKRLSSTVYGYTFLLAIPRRPSPLALLRFAVPLPSTAVHGPPRVPRSRVRSRAAQCPGSALRFPPGHGCG